MQYVAKISSKNQVTLPADIRRSLGIGADDRVAFVVDAEGVHLKPVRRRLEDFFGFVPARGDESDDFKQEIEAAMDEAARELLHETGAA